MSLIDDQNINTTPISSLGEFGLIDHRKPYKTINKSREVDTNYAKYDQS